MTCVQSESSPGTARSPSDWCVRIGTCGRKLRASSLASSLHHRREPDGDPMQGAQRTQWEYNHNMRTHVGRFLLYSWCSLFGIPTRVPLHRLFFAGYPLPFQTCSQRERRRSSGRSLGTGSEFLCAPSMGPVPLKGDLKYGQLLCRFVRAYQNSELLAHTGGA